MRKSIILTGLLLLFGVWPQASNGNLQQDPVNPEKVEIYYFHATARCATCKAVEKVTKETMKDLDSKKVSFVSINREEDKDNPLIKKHKVTGQTLLVISGDKVVNLTNDAFLNARTKPEVLKEKIRETVGDMLK
jgi:hypothetical protein